MRRQPFALALLLVLAACGGTGGSTAPPITNPAPRITPVETIDMSGTWEITGSSIVAATSLQPEPLPVGTMVVINEANEVVAVSLGGDAITVSRSSFEQTHSVTFDWWENYGDGSFLDFGFGWDKLRSTASGQGGGGPGPSVDFYQYGFRVVALGQDLLSGYEAAVTQPLLSDARTEWLASVVLVRSGP